GIPASGESLRLGAEASVAFGLGGRKALGFAQSPVHQPQRTPAHIRAAPGRNPVCMAQSIIARSRAEYDPALGVKAGRDGESVFSPTHENQVGQLQSCRRAYPPE